MKENFPDYELLFKPSKQKSFVGEKQREKKKGAKKKRAGGFTFLSLSIIDVSLSLSNGATPGACDRPPRRFISAV